MIGLFLILPLQTETFSLKKTPIVGEVRYFAEKLLFKAEGQDVVSTSTLRTTVKEVATDGGYTVEESSKVTGVTIGGSPGTLPTAPSSTVLSFSPTGAIEIISSGIDDPSQLRIEQFFQFFPPAKPIAVGATWERVIPFDKKKVLAAVKFTYTLANQEMVDDQKTLKITIAATEMDGEQKASIDGTLWVDKLTFVPLKEQLNFHQLKAPGLSTPIEGSFTIQKLKDDDASAVKAFAS